MATTRRQFGRYAIHDARDGEYLLASRRRTVTRRRIWRTTWVGDQDVTPHCVGFMGSGLLWCQPIRQWLDPHGLYALAQQNDEWEGEDYDGTSVRGLAKVLKALGLIREYRWAFKLQPALTHLLDKGPVGMGTNWYYSMFEPNARGYLEIDGEVAGGHAWLAYGADLDKREVYGVNSYGRTFGRRGRFVLTFDQYERLILEDGEALAAIEQKARPS